MNIFRKFSGSQIIAGGFFLLILIGAFLLSLPVSSASGEPTNYFDCVFTATSALCVTGLVVLDTGTYWSVFGKFIIITLIQIGGVGFMSLATMPVIFSGKKISFSQRMLVKDSLGISVVNGVVKLLKNILLLVVTIELIGAALLSIVFVPQFGFKKGILYGLFHSISAFCNAGFDIMGNFSSLTAYQSSVIVNVTIMLLIIFGGLGFVVLVDGLHFKLIKKISLQSKVVLIVTSILIIFPTILFFLLEKGNSLATMTLKDSILASLFQVVSPRTAGFNTLELASLRESTSFLMIILMFIGGSPGSTAGGLKTTTIFVIIVSALSLIKNKPRVEAFKRTISYDIVNKALIILCLAFFLIITGTMIISFTNPEFSFMQVLYEVTSAYATVGLTLGITPKLNLIARVVLIIIMYFGRVGSLTVLYSFIKPDNKTGYEYPKEDVEIG